MRWHVDSNTAAVRFGAFEFDPRSGELRTSDSRVLLQEQPLRILIRLLDRPGALVTRDELRRELWSDETFVDFEHGLNAAVKRLRDALGDCADEPRFIETLPRRGYRFVAQVAPAIAGTRRMTAPRRALLLAGAAALIAASWIATRTIPGRPPPIRSIAVLPFSDAGTPGQEYFAHGLTEAIGAELARTSSLRVVSA